jgi:hypothetical protein
MKFQTEGRERERREREKDRERERMRRNWSTRINLSWHFQGWGCSSVVENLPGTCKVLGSSPALIKWPPPVYQFMWQGVTMRAGGMARRSTWLASTKPWVQTPILPQKDKVLTRTPHTQHWDTWKRLSFRPRRNSKGCNPRPWRYMLRQVCLMSLWHLRLDASTDSHVTCHAGWCLVYQTFP